MKKVFGLASGMCMFTGMALVRSTTPGIMQDDISIAQNTMCPM